MKKTQQKNGGRKLRGSGDPLFQKVIARESAPAHPAVARGIVFTVQNFNRSIQLKELVEISGMSRRGFTKAFNRHVGDTPAAVLRQMRIEHAKRLLMTQDLNLKQLARKCGYRSENTFCVAFQRAVGMAPKKFQRSTWLEISQNSRLPEMMINNIPTQFHRESSRFHSVSCATP